MANAQNQTDDRSDAEAKAQAAADAKAKADAEAKAAAKRPLDETIPGGRYLVNGKYVDANGKPIEGNAEDGE